MPMAQSLLVDKMLSTEAALEILQKHLAGIHDQLTHGRHQPGSDTGADPRIGKLPGGKITQEFLNRRHVLRVLTNVYVERYVNKQRKIYERNKYEYAFVWSDNLKPVQGRELDRVRGISERLPSNVDNVRINLDKDADLLATWTDRKGVLKYGYSLSHTLKSNAQKYKRLAQFEKVLPIIERKIANDMNSDDPETRQKAMIMYVINKTAFRPGGLRDTKGSKEAYGVATLLNKHISFDKKSDGSESVIFNFPGKLGKQMYRSVRDKKMAEALRSIHNPSQPNGRLFAEVKDPENDLGPYLKKISGGDFSPKDFRTYRATYKAKQFVNQIPEVCRTETEFRQRQSRVAGLVASYLGNTPRVALRDYIDPHVWTAWRQPEWGVWMPSDMVEP